MNIISKKNIAAGAVVAAAMAAALSASAAAQFPNQYPLQPFPAAGGAHANVSGNINSTVVPQGPAYSAEQAAEAAPAPILPAPEEEGNRNLEIGFALGILVLVAGFFAARRLKK